MLPVGSPDRLPRVKVAPERVVVARVVVARVVTLLTIRLVEKRAVVVVFVPVAFVQLRLVMVELALFTRRPPERVERPKTVNVPETLVLPEESTEKSPVRLLVEVATKKASERNVEVVDPSVT